MGDGVRQFTSLLRKNVLLKCRRPCATAFEIALPLVLFLLLVYVRTVYETVWYGPFYYRNHVLTPFGAASVNELDSKALRDNGAPWAPWFDKQSDKLPDEDSGLLSFSQLAIGEGLCSREFKNTVADGLEAVLSFRLASGLTLADELLRLDPLVVGNAMTEGIDTAYKFLTDGAAPSVGASLRQDFFASGLDGSVKEVGDRLQTEINTLASLLDAADGPAQAGQLAEGWYREACATNASALVGTNVTALSNLLYDLGQALEAAGVASLLQPGMYPHRERAELLLLSAAEILRDAVYLFDPRASDFSLPKDPRVVGVHFHDDDNDFQEDEDNLGTVNDQLEYVSGDMAATLRIREIQKELIRADNSDDPNGRKKLLSRLVRENHPDQNPGKEEEVRPVFEYCLKMLRLCKDTV